ncbi:LysR family transcriptional regulator [Streptomyces sp. NPDC050161]|uniref:LysR family transcriptional regulator n=1 Tax=Streptomyces sp. NPDC050161 TaxID=3365604 RepID=UPI0037923B2E
MPRYAPGVELEVRHLRAVCAVADHGSVRKAARQLGMTQPSLTTQLHRIEKALGGQLFFRESTGSRPTPLGHVVLSRARPIVADMRALVDEIASASVSDRGARLHIGSTSSRAVAGWLRRLRLRLPGTEPTIRTDVSANALLQMVAAGQLDVAFVHEVEGAPLRVPPNLVEHELIAREPQFIALPETHPATAKQIVELTDLAGDPWMVDPTVDGEWAGLRRIWAAAGVNPRVVHGDYLTAADLVAAGEVVTPCQPTSRPRHGMDIRPLRGDPLAVRLFMACRRDAVLAAPAEALFADLTASYMEIAWASAAYRAWLGRHDGPLPVAT